MRHPSEELRETMRRKTHEELYEILQVRSQDYTLYALGVAKDELARRQLDKPALNGFVLAGEKALKEKNASEGRPGNDSFVVLIGLCCMGLILYGVYGWADSAGYVPHFIETSISAKQDWIVGESKDCTSNVLSPTMADSMKMKSSYVAASIECDDGPHHDMQTKIYGRLEQPDHRIVQWRCTRDSESFTCRQMAAE
jgi:hypothetical protein